MNALLAVEHGAAWLWGCPVGSTWRRCADGVRRRMHYDVFVRKVARGPSPLGCYTVRPDGREWRPSPANDFWGLS